MTNTTQWILALTLVATGLLTAVYGFYTFGFSLTDVNTLSLLLGGIFLVAVGICIPASMPVLAKLGAIWLTALLTIYYIHHLPELDLIFMLMSDVPVLALAAWLSTLF